MINIEENKNIDIPEYDKEKYILAYMPQYYGYCHELGGYVKIGRYPILLDKEIFEKELEILK